MQQYHFFSIFNANQQASIINDGYAYVDINCPFTPTVYNISVGYKISGNDLADVIVTSDLTNGGIVGLLNKFSDNNAGVLTVQDGIKKTNEFSYKPLQPVPVKGSYKFSFNNQTAMNIALCQIVIHIEFLA